MRLSWQRFFALLHARNIEFIRDRAALSWNLLFPVLMMVGFAFIFSQEEQPLFKVGVYDSAGVGHPFLQSHYLQFIPIANDSELATAVTKVERHQLDLLLALDAPPRYWINSSSAAGYVTEQMLRASDAVMPQRQLVSGDEVRYVDWLVPGVLGMNMMFSALYGIGFVLVRYRKNGVLKRFHATPVTSLEFITAQICSRLLLIVVSAIMVYLLCDLLLNFAMYGSYLALFCVLLVGGFNLIALGLIIAARLRSDEVANGLINLLTMPMMVLSGVWFSLEGSPAWLIALADLLPLTHIVTAARLVMIDGAGVTTIMPQLATLTVMGLLFLLIGTLLFRWDD
ncbi:MAG: ABC transporter permease [Gammaproteobacteria bacterium]|nr:ABC transporter permease [Gammaproteobacteria bacterium]